MKAIALVSGGLDSLLAARLVKEQGIDIIAFYFYIPFCSRKENTPNSYSDNIKKVAEDLGVELRIINISEEFMGLLENPRHGYGSNINPCIDCKILMLRKTKEYMQEVQASFVITGEVLGQRPMSQHRRALTVIDEDSDLKGLILRPLSAKLLQETIAEKEGWVCRDKLLNFNGRGRKPQMELAKIFGFTDYSNPAGGCLLTDPLFAKKVRDLIRLKELSFGNVELLKVGRHFRLSDKAKLVVGRDQKENDRLLGLAVQGDYLFLPSENIAGATALARGMLDDELLRLSAGITSRYFDLQGKTDCEVVCRKFPTNEEQRLKVSVINGQEMESLRI